MAKRKADEKDTRTKMDIDRNDGSSDDDEDLETIDVDLEFLGLNSEIDFHGIKALLRQLLDVDNTLVDISALTDVILGESIIGSTVKCDGEESDPYALIAVLPLHHLRDSSAIQGLQGYLVSQTSKASGALSKLSDLLSPSSNFNVGLIVSERLINMPHQIVPALYTLLTDEISSAQSDSATTSSASSVNYNFSHYLILSRTYTEVESQLDGQDSRPSKKSKAGAKASSELFYFHPEDEVIHRFATDVVAYDFTNQGDDGASDARRTFQEWGVRPQGHMSLVEAARLPELVAAIKEYLGSE